MTNNIRSFSEWSPIYEGKDNAGNRAKEALSVAFGEVVHVPDFIEFGRQGEPKQTSHLFGDKSGNNFSFNFTASGELYSVDVYPKGADEASITLYANGADVTQMVNALVKKLGVAVKEAVEMDDVEIEYKDGKRKKLQMVASSPKITEVKPKPKNTQKVKDISVDYEYGDPKTMFKDLVKYTEMVAKTIQPALLICGSGGVGKSFKVNQTLNNLNLTRGTDYFVIKGKATAAGMYIKLFENNGKLTIFDDCDSIFDDDNGVNILKGALDSDEVREISWNGAHSIKSPTTGETIPSTFNYTGQAIFITNRSKKSLSAVLGPIKSRAFVIEVALSPADMVDYIKGLLPTMMKDEPVSLKNFAFKIIQSVAKQNPEMELNLRTMLKAVKIIKYVEDLADAKRMIAQQCING